MSDLGTFDLEIRLATYRSFLDEGRAPVPAEIAEIVGSSPAEVEAAFRRLHDAHVLVLAPGTPYIWMANPFSALPTPFKVSSDSRTYWGNCIWDALGIATILDADSDVVCRCGDCGEVLTLEVRGDELSPQEHLVHFAVPAAQWWDDIGFN